MGKNIKQFTKADNQMADSHIKKSSMSWIAEKFKLKPQWDIQQKT